MQATNIPIQVIALCGTDGQIKPLRFRYEDASHRTCTIHVQEVTDVRRVDVIQMEALMFLCKAREADGDRMYELKYTIGTHRWELFRRIY